MNIRRKCVFFAALVALAIAHGGVLDKAWIKGLTDKNPLSYTRGETMVFTLTIQGLDGKLPLDEYFLEWTRSGDDGLKESGKVAIVEGPFVYSTKIEKAGFVRLQARIVDKNGRAYVKSYTGDTTTPEGRKAMNAFEKKNQTVFFDGSAGADVGSLRTEAEPTDFDAFWKRQFARLDKVPLKVERIELESSNSGLRIYAVQVACAGLRPVTGYLTVPRDVEKGATYPAVIGFWGYRGAIGMHKLSEWSANEGRIFLDINAHGMKLPAFGATEADLRALRWEVGSNGFTYGFDPKQNDDPELSYFNGMVLRIKRALQFLKTVEGWNGKDLVAIGGSQGGLQAIWAGGCGEGVTRIECYVPWCCDMFTSGTFRKDPKFNFSGDGWYIGWAKGLAYYDAAVFAARIPQNCFTYITRAGLGDYCCPPTGIVKMWHNIPGNKKIVWVQGSQHGTVPPEYEGRDIIWEEH